MVSTPKLRLTKSIIVAFSVLGAAPSPAQDAKDFLNGIVPLELAAPIMCQAYFNVLYREEQESEDSDPKSVEFYRTASSWFQIMSLQQLVRLRDLEAIEARNQARAQVYEALADEHEDGTASDAGRFCFGALDKVAEATRALGRVPATINFELHEERVLEVFPLWREVKAFTLFQSWQERGFPAYPAAPDQ